MCTSTKTPLNSPVLCPIRPRRGLAQQGLEQLLHEPLPLRQYPLEEDNGDELSLAPTRLTRLCKFPRAGDERCMCVGFPNTMELISFSKPKFSVGRLIEAMI